MAIKNIHDEDVAVRRELALSLGTSPRELAILVDDDDPLTSCFAAANPNTPEEAKEDVDFSGQYLYGVWVDESDSYSFETDEWMYHISSDDPNDICKNAVIISNEGNDNYEEPHWWISTLDYLKRLDFNCSLEDFIYAHINDNDFQVEFEIYEDDWEEALTDIYNAYKSYGYSLNTNTSESLEDILNFKFDVVEILYPYKTFKRVKANDPYGRGAWVTVLYDWDNLDTIYERDLQTWYFWDIYEARYKWLDLEQLRETDFEDLIGYDVWDFFDRFGDYGDEWEFIKGPDFRAAQQSGTLFELITDELGLARRDCILI